MVGCGRIPEPVPVQTAAPAIADVVLALTSPVPDVPDVPDVPPPTAHTFVTQVRAAAFADHPDVLVHIPTSFDTRGPLNVVVYLHGWNGCIAVTAADQDAPCSPDGRTRSAMSVVSQFDRGQPDAVLLLPQLAFDRPTTAPGRLGERGGFRALLAELLEQPDVASLLGGPHSPEGLGRVVLFAHSAAYVPAAAMLERGGVDVDDVFLLDAVYRNLPAFASWGASHARDLRPDLPSHRHFAIVYTDREGTGQNSRLLISQLAGHLSRDQRTRAVWDDRSLVSPSLDALGHPLFVQRTSARHEDIPRLYLAPLLAVAGLGVAASSRVLQL